MEGFERRPSSRPNCGAASIRADGGGATTNLLSSLETDWSAFGGLTRNEATNPTARQANTTTPLKQTRTGLLSIA